MKGDGPRAERIAGVELSSEVGAPAAGIGSEFGLSPTLLIPGRGGGGFPIDPGEHGILLQHGRGALVYVLRWLSRREPRRREVVLPLYVCDSVVEAVEHAGMEARYYDVDRNLCPDTEGLVSSISDRSLAVVLVHYFGFLQPEHYRSQIAERAPSVSIIDDTSHAFLNQGVHSDNRTSGIRVGSLRKHGPVPDLAYAVFPGGFGSPSGNALRFAAARTLALCASQWYHWFPIGPLRKVRRSLATWGERIAASDPEPRNPSALSRWVLRRLDWSDIVEQRRRNYECLLEVATEFDWVRPVFPELDPDVCPLMFPVYVEDRDRLQRFLAEYRIYAPVHWRPGRSRGEVYEHSTARWVTDHILSIPIDQRYTPDDLHAVGRAWKRYQAT